MVYSFQLWRHPNIHYREAVLRLGRCELLSMLKSLSVEADIQVEQTGNVSFFTFESRELSPPELAYLAGHSTLTLMAEKQGFFLRPLSVHSADPLPEDLPEILKYKGKTNPAFTRMMLNTGLALTPFVHQPQPVTVLDPLCGKGTSLFSALCMGADAVGIDTDRKDLKEASDFFSRYLKNAGMKHSIRSFSTTAASSGIPGTSFTFSCSRENWNAGITQSLTLHAGDSALASSLLRRHRAHLLVADLPYGIQHAPQGSTRSEPFGAFLARVLPAWRSALLPGAAAVLSFNTLTLKKAAVSQALSAAGFETVDAPEFSNLSHAVEQAVVRDLVFARVS